jgi:hypothetical protein
MAYVIANRELNLDRTNVDEDTLTVETLPVYLARFNRKWNKPDIGYRLTRSRSKNRIPCERINGELIFSKQKIARWIKGDKDVSIQARR